MFRWLSGTFTAHTMSATSEQTESSKLLPKTLKSHQILCYHDFVSGSLWMPCSWTIKSDVLFSRTTTSITKTIWALIVSEGIYYFVHRNILNVNYFDKDVKQTTGGYFVCGQFKHDRTTWRESAQLSKLLGWKPPVHLKHLKLMLQLKLQFGSWWGYVWKSVLVRLMTITSRKIKLVPVGQRN